jgi:Ca2+-transporting ATPase
VVALQIVAVHWPPAQAVFGMGGMGFADWGIAAAVAATILLLEERRKFVCYLVARVNEKFN